MTEKADSKFKRGDTVYWPRIGIDNVNKDDTRELNGFSVSVEKGTLAEDDDDELRLVEQDNGSLRAVHTSLAAHTRADAFLCGYAVIVDIIGSDVEQALHGKVLPAFEQYRAQLDEHCHGVLGLSIRRNGEDG